MRQFQSYHENADTWSGMAQMDRRMGGGGPPARDERRWPTKSHWQRVGVRRETATSSVQHTWEWDGESWVQANRRSGKPRARTRMTYDVVRQRVVLFGGALAPRGTATHWEWNGRAGCSEPEAPTRSIGNG